VIRVYDDVVPHDMNVYHKVLVMGTADDNGYPWVDTTEIQFCHAPTAHLQAPDNDRMHWSFFHELVDNGAPISQHYYKFDKLVEMTFAKAFSDNLFREGMQYRVHRARIVLDYPQQTNYECGVKHIDAENGIGILYYLNDAEGDTVFYDESNKIIEKVSPKSGRVVLFDASIEHSPGLSKKEHRYIVNYTIETDKQ
jgi:hypothetical protein